MTIDLDEEIRCPVCYEDFENFNLLKEHCLESHNFYDKVELTKYLLEEFNK